MIPRRDFFIGAASLAAAGTAYGLKPRKPLNLLGKYKMADIIPVSFGPWESQSVDELVRPETEGRLAALLYSELVSRIYFNKDTGDAVMMLVAYGDTQSDLLQLHRPESCYPAVGYSLILTEPQKIKLRGNFLVPGRRVIAERSDIQERILYWARLGEYLPAGAGEQREARLRSAMQGFVPDGALFRFSSTRRGESTFLLLETFISDLIMSTPQARRSSLIGSDLARRISA
jgi:EpsI family protein